MQGAGAAPLLESRGKASGGVKGQCPLGPPDERKESHAAVNINVYVFQSPGRDESKHSGQRADAGACGVSRAGHEFP